MPKIFDVETYPPFEGFPEEGLEFFRKLKKNNNRHWFEKHKNEFEDYAKLPMCSLIESLRPHFARFAQEFDLSPKRSIFRIYRDIRFSKDKTPYKTHIAAHFVLRGKPKGLIGLGYYLHIEPGEVFIGGGVYIPDGEQLRKIRYAISTHSKEFHKIVTAKPFVKCFGTIEGEKLKRVPAGYNPTDPMAEWLKLKQFFVGISLPDNVCKDASFVNFAAKVCEEATPLVRFLIGATR
jgi:uncharacterized protein (TIGR02453 family)